jgi:hypothetical protein
MSLHVKKDAVRIVTSVVSASAPFPAEGQNLPYFRVVNNSSSLCYVNTGMGSATATNANVAVAPNDFEIFRKGDSVSRTGFDDTVAVVLEAGVGIVSVTSVDYPVR